MAATLIGELLYRWDMFKGTYHTVHLTCNFHISPALPPCTSHSSIQPGQRNLELLRAYVQVSYYTDVTQQINVQWQMRCGVFLVSWASIVTAWEEHSCCCITDALTIESVYKFSVPLLVIHNERQLKICLLGIVRSRLSQVLSLKYTLYCSYIVKWFQGLHPQD